MSSFYSPSPLTIPFKFRRKSSSASTTVSMDNSPDIAALSSSPLPSSSPPLTPLHLTRRYDCTEWQAGDHFDALHGVMYDQQDKVDPWPCHDHPLPFMHQPLPSLMSKFAAHTLRSAAPLAYSPSLLSSAPQTTYFYPQGDSAIADGCEEYDLESMDIHIRETYFATSAERGRWLSSPIAPRVRSQVIPSMRGHSSPVKTSADTSLVKEHSRMHTKSRSMDKQISISLSEDRDEDTRCPSSLPPSSPLTSPVSNLSFLGDDCEHDSVVDPRSNSDDCHSPTRTPALSISSTTYTSPIELTRTPSPHEASAISPAFQSTKFSCYTPGSVISRHTSPLPGQSPTPIDIHVHASGATSREPGDVLSSLSQFELDLLEEEPSKPPLSDTVNKPYPGVRTTSPGVTLDAARYQDAPPSIQSLSMSSNHQSLDVSLTISGPSSNKKTKKRREYVADSPGAKRTKKRAAIRSESSSSDAKERRGAEILTSSHSEPPNKKSKLSHCRDVSESRGVKSLPRGGISKVERHSRSPSRPVDEDSGSTCPRDRKTSKRTGHGQLQECPPATTDAVDAEFHVSLMGMLIEAFATSRATSMDSSALYLVLTQAHPYLAAERSKEELLIAMAAVLEAGRARCGMFEKVDSSGDKSRHKALESRWFYVPERDEDRERASLISTIMPRQKRNETKKYKQYYYQPLDKISRWDPEDAP